jgi:threonine aldolase
MRKLLGGGMRQAGVIAAAGVYALEHMVERLADDHANAKALARGLAELPMVDLDPESIETNIVIFGVPDSFGFVRALKQAGVLATIPMPGRVRMVTHYGIERADIDEALERVRHAAAAAV